MEVSNIKKERLPLYAMFYLAYQYEETDSKMILIWKLTPPPHPPLLSLSRASQFTSCHFWWDSHAPPWTL